MIERFNNNFQSHRPQSSHRRSHSFLQILSNASLKIAKYPLLLTRTETRQQRRHADTCWSLMDRCITALQAFLYQVLRVASRWITDGLEWMLWFLSSALKVHLSKTLQDGRKKRTGRRSYLLRLMPIALDDGPSSFQRCTAHLRALRTR